MCQQCNGKPLICHLMVLTYNISGRLDYLLRTSLREIDVKLIINGNEKHRPCPAKMHNVFLFFFHLIKKQRKRTID